jgi:hypothetical protein
LSDMEVTVVQNVPHIAHVQAQQLVSDLLSWRDPTLICLGGLVEKNALKCCQKLGQNYALIVLPAREKVSDAANLIRCRGLDEIHVLGFENAGGSFPSVWDLLAVHAYTVTEGVRIGFEVVTPVSLVSQVEGTEDGVR